MYIDKFTYLVLQKVENSQPGLPYFFSRSYNQSSSTEKVFKDILVFVRLYNCFLLCRYSRFVSLFVNTVTFVVYFDQQTQACTYGHMVENNKKRSKN